MPDRVVRAGILSSDLVNKLSWAGEVFYRRMMQVADDFGRYDGRTEIVRAALYPLRLDKVSAADIDKWKAECAQADLISCYHVEGKEYVQINNFNQRLRSMKSKYPAPLTNASTRQRMTADDNIRGQVRPETETESETETEVEVPNGPWDCYPKADCSLMLDQWEIDLAIEWVSRLKKLLLTKERIADFWAAFLLNLSGSKFYQDRGSLVQHFRNWLKDQKLEESTSPHSKSEPSVASQIKAARAKQTT